MRFLSATVLWFFCCLTGVAIAQQPGGSRSTMPGSTSNPTGGITGTSGNTSPFPGSNTAPRPIFISGIVALTDGSPLPDRAKIERVCNGAPKLEGYTDRKGRFNIEVGHSLEAPDATAATGIPEGMRNRSQSSQNGTSDRALWSCDLRAALPGYRS